MLDKIQDKIIQSLRDKNKELTIVLKDIKHRLTQTKKENNGTLEDKDILSVLQKMAKQRRQSIKEFKKGNRNDLIMKENFELTVIESYLPKQLSKDDIIPIG